MINRTSREYEELHGSDLEQTPWRLIEDLRSDKTTFRGGSSRRISSMVIPSIMLLSAICLYLSASANCPYQRDGECASWYINPNILSLTIRTVASAILFSLTIFLGFSSSIFSRKISILSVITVIYLTFIHNRSNEHGNYLIDSDSIKNVTPTGKIHKGLGLHHMVL